MILKVALQTGIEVVILAGIVYCLYMFLTTTKNRLIPRFWTQWSLAEPR